MQLELIIIETEFVEEDKVEKPKEEEKEYESPNDSGFPEKKKREIFKCPHKNRKHYAKVKFSNKDYQNMCIDCYHRRGRTKKAWLCSHSEKLHYSKGLC